MTSASEAALVPTSQRLLPAIPILFLKNPSQPTDSYETHFSTPHYKPIFVPVLSHQFIDTTLHQLAQLLPSFETQYSGLIITSQRAAEALASVLQRLAQENAEASQRVKASHRFPIYTVGPATSRAVEAIRDEFLPECTVEGKDTGNGEALAEYILKNHGKATDDNTPEIVSQPQATDLLPHRLPLLFLIGDQRRDVIPKTLASPSLPATQRIPVSELVVYTTSTNPSFPSLLASALESASDAPVVWLVVFSPAGCEAMLEWLRGRFGKVNEEEEEEGQREMHVASIGPTTRDYLRDEFGFWVDVCAERPSPEGVREGLEGFMARRKEVGRGL